MFGRNKQSEYQYDSALCEKACGTSEPSIGAYSFVEAVRQIVDAPKPMNGPPLILLAEEGSINPHDLPDNVTVVYYATGAPTPELISAGY